MKFLLTGRTGQLGRELEMVLGTLGELIACGRSDMDFSRPRALPALIRRHRPDVIVNAAAYTAVDRAQTESKLAHLVNAEAVAALAEEARRSRALLIHYSTDYVFDGAATRPYRESDPAAPLGVYGLSKLAGEAEIVASGARHLILRTSWVYSAHGSNFVLTMLRLARERPQLRVVDDQSGAPTWSRDLAAATLAALRGPAPLEGLYHVSSAGQTTWWGFASRILQLAGLHTPVAPIGTDQYPTAARRPAYSVLDSQRYRQSTGFAIGPWDLRLEAFMQDAGLAVAGA